MSNVNFGIKVHSRQRLTHEADPEPGRGGGGGGLLGAGDNLKDMGQAGSSPGKC